MSGQVIACNSAGHLPFHVLQDVSEGEEIVVLDIDGRSIVSAKQNQELLQEQIEHVLEMCALFN